ncbi:MAG: transglycosylase domain-containing protein [Fimbriimonadaceae bacterium]|nr:transglycosylase domain-containing protein [Fimbriimonadaceae bacterium]
MQRVEPRIRTRDNRPKPRSRWKRITLIALVVFWTLIAAGFVAGSAFLWWRLDQANALVPGLQGRLESEITRPSEIVSSDGTVLLRLAAEYRDPVEYADIPKHVVDATIAAEDKRYFEHDGVDTVAMMRVLWGAALTGHASQGGSTITMQLAKRVFSDSQRTVDRKIQDISLALMMERNLSKEQILEVYLNQVFYGEGAYGISAAADVYFGKKLKDLTIAEAATLSRLVRRPSQENPFRDPDVALKNRNVVLGIMRDEGLITKAEFDKAVAEPLKLRKERIQPVNVNKTSPFFTDFVLEYIREKYPNVDLLAGGYRVETTLNLKLQKIVDEEVERTLRVNRGNRVTTAAFFLMDNEGRIAALRGGGNYERNQYNVATSGRRQPGSSFKPFVYSAAFEYGALSPGGTVSNEPYYIRLGNGQRKKIDGGGSGGRLSVASAVAASNNTCAMWAIKGVGPGNAVRLAHSAFGFTSELPRVESLALGTGEVSMLEMARGYTVFQSGGDRYEPYAIVRIIAANGAVVVRNAPKKSNRVVSASTAQGMDMILRTVVTGGTARAASGVVNARGKTGTTNSHKDAWFCGYTDRWVGIGWVANDVPNPNGNPPFVAGTMAGVFGGQVTAPMWARIMTRVQKEIPEERRTLQAYRGAPPDPDDDTQTDDEQSAEDEARENERPDREPPTGPGEATPQNPPGDPATTPPNGFPPVNNPPEDPRPPTDPKQTNPPSTTGGSTGGGSTTGGGGNDLISVEICVDSGARAGASCPERRRIKVPRNQAPRERCPLHG